ncbi:MAG: TonB-dependent receptor plug domain-containing protein [Candidatus Eremiobacter antarcticus]|nr:TonB-dependent receptor [Candidatus Eremiobacteraeota bacterium]
MKATCDGAGTGVRNALLACISVAILIASQPARAAGAPSGARPQPSATATAQPSPAPTPAPKATVLKKIDSIVVTAQRHPTALSDTPRENYLLLEADLERVGARTAADALRFIPAAVVQQYGAAGSLQTAALRGASSAQTLVLIDGRPANEADTGLFDFSSIPADSVQRLEIVEGGSSTLYGSAAIGGVINILTKQPGATTHVDSGMELGYRGAFTRRIALDLGRRNGVAARVDGSAVSADDAFDYPALPGLEAAGTRSNDDAKIRHAGLTVSGPLGAMSATAAFGVDTSAVGSPGSVFFASSLARQQRVYQRSALDLSAPAWRGTVSLQLYADGKRLHFYDPTQPFALDTLATGITRGAGIRTTQALDRRNLLTAGFDSRADVATFSSAFSGAPAAPAAVVRDATDAWYVQDEMHAPQAPFTATLGWRHESIQGTSGATVPSVGLLERLGPHADAQANYARAFHTPSLDDRYYPGFGDPSLQPEYSATFDVGLRSHRDNRTASLTYFGSDTNNLIVNVPIDSFGDLKPYNVNRARVRGVSAALEATVGGVCANISYSDYLTAADLTAGKPMRLAYRPTATASAQLSQRLGGLEYGLTGAFVGKRFADAANTRLLPAYLLGGAYVRAAMRTLSITLRAENLGNNHHAEDVFGYPVVGSSLSVRISTVP